MSQQEAQKDIRHGRKYGGQADELQICFQGIAFDGWGIELGLVKLTRPSFMLAAILELPPSLQRPSLLSVELLAWPLRASCHQRPVWDRPALRL